MASYFFEVLETVENPEFIVRGNKGTLKATTNTERGKWLVAVYREIRKKDGFVITAYFLDKKPKGDEKAAERIAKTLTNSLSPKTTPRRCK